MNKPCMRCGKIMLVPDIPLPSTYKQKCTNCGFQNPVGDELFFDSEPDADSVNLLDQDDSQELDLSQGIDKSNADRWMAQLAESPPQVATTPTSTGIDREELKRIIDERIQAAMQDVRAEMMTRLSELEVRLKGRMSKSQPTPVSQPATTPQVPQEDSPTTSLSEVVAVKEVLLCTQNQSVLNACRSSLQSQGFSVEVVSSYSEALKHIQDYAYQVFLFDQRFIQGSPEGQTVLASINKITLPIRRHQAVIMITPGIPSGESQVFYQWGVDLNVHPEQIREVGALSQELIQHKQSLLDAYLHSDLDTDRIVL